MDPSTAPAPRRADARARVVALYEAWHAARPDAGFDDEAARWRAGEGE